MPDPEYFTEYYIFNVDLDQTLNRFYRIILRIRTPNFAYIKMTLLNRNIILFFVLHSHKFIFSTTSCELF